MIRKIYHGLYKKFEPFCNHPINAIFADTTVLATTSYFIVKKISGFSASDKMKEYFTDSGVDMVVIAVIIAIGYSVAIRLACAVFTRIPATSQVTIEAEGLSTIFMAINSEIEGHISKINSKSRASCMKNISNHHDFEKNIGLIVTQLVEHIQRSVTGIKLKRRDLFVTVYQLDGFQTGHEFQGELEYLTHFDPRRDIVSSKTIDFTDSKFENYECVKCYYEKKKVWVSSDQKSYQKEGNKRSKLVENYIGFPLSIGTNLVGFLNIEFHRNKRFHSDDEMLEYVETDIIAFKYLLEYQFLKRRLFGIIENECVTCNLQEYEKSA
jgi:hypothetical protein